MIIQFTVRPDQGPPGGFDLGDMLWRGDLGEANSAGHHPDQGMMIHLAVTQLLDAMSGLLAGGTATSSFVGTDSSFTLTFKAVRAGVSVASASGKVAVVSRAALAITLLRAAEELADSTAASLPADDGVLDDYTAALNRFRGIAHAL
ncbi:hypothetical protein [Streptomyces sp. NRRL F-4428]|uniref:hypothetical protein n=1 Tax=Streptomyces sp. NRRL F-4428 TaxID=1609137 RepID=UPI0005EC45E7|nr:hypothetical protein [Streptomyces sp. NRRL F-4428]KJK48576.1 hypothetical protein UK14_17825 [Streptomyces sp. NRRL F-4428]